MWTSHLQFVLAALAGWVNRHQHDVIEYLQAENRILREQMGDRRPRFTDAQRRRLAVAAKKVGRAKLYDIEPVPERRRKISWNQFLKSHWGAIAATDFFTVEVLTMRGLVRYLVLFVIDLKTRRIAIAGIERQANGVWMEQVARNLTDAEAGFLCGAGYLIHDRDPLFMAEFRRILRAGGVDSLRLPARSPNLNAYAERFVRSIKSECLAQIIPLGERHLRKTVTEFTEHYHLERNHQGIENRLIEDTRRDCTRTARIRRHERLGGTLSYYYREAE
jgi:transposase InsO family protein